MRLIAYRTEGRDGLALSRGDDLLDLGPITLQGVLEAGPEALAALDRQADRAPALDARAIRHRPPLPRPPKIICVGLNYADHTKESPYQQPTYPTVFPRFASSLIGHGDPIRRPLCSVQLDYEGELVAVIGRAGRHIARDRALDHVAGYSVFNEAAIRDYQFKTPQWTVGKNFDSTGAFGPAFVTADELPAGGRGLRLETRLNGVTVQSASTADMLFDVAEIVATLSEAFTLEVGDVLVTGTPAGVGFGRKPPVWMRHGDMVEVEIEGVGLLRNPVLDAER